MNLYTIFFITKYDILQKFMEVEMQIASYPTYTSIFP